MDKNQQANDFEDFSMNFQDNYNEQEFLKNASKKTEKLTIMEDFNELCQKLNYLADQDKDAQKEAENALMQYYVQCKEKIQEQPQTKKQLQKLKNTQNNILNSKLNKPSPIRNQTNIRSTTETHPPTPTTPNRMTIYPINHERNPSQGQIQKKILQQIETNQNKRNYSSVEEKKKILQPSKNMAKQNQALAIKDYFGDQNNFVSKKVHGKNFINKDAKTSKQTLIQHTINQNKQSSNSQAIKYSNENSLKQSNLITTMRRSQGVDRQMKQAKQFQRPKIIMYRKIIDLTQNTDSIIEAFKNEQMKSDYEIFNEFSSNAEEGLFAKAIVNQRASKTHQNAQSPSSNYNYLQPTFKQNGKQYIQSPISISYSPNPTNNYKSIFQKREIYR